MALRFLIVDDSYIDRLVASILIKKSWDKACVDEASGGQKALEWLSSCQLSEEDRLVLLLDVMMPQMNGFEFLESFEQLDISVRDRATVVMLSSTIDPDDIARAEQHPRVKTLLSKPLSAQILKQAL